VGLGKIDSIQISIDSELIFQDIGPFFGKLCFYYNQIDSIELFMYLIFDGNIQSTFLLTNGNSFNTLSFDGEK